MLKAGIVGIGFMGWIHYLAYQRSSHAMLTAFCSRDPKKRQGDWSSIKGNFGPPGEQIAMEHIKAFDSYDDMLKDNSLDFVDICLPPSLHVEAVCKALAAGKHVLCEKPLGLTTSECDEIVAAAKKYDRQVLVAQVLPYMGPFEFVYKAVREGTYGQVLRAHLKRVISPPDWIPDFYDPTKVGGPLIDLHVHDTHFVKLLCGMPKRVMCSAEMREGVVKYCHSLMEFADPQVTVSTSSGVSDQTARPFCHAFEIQFERALIQFELTVLPDGVDSLPLRIFKQDGTVEEPNLPESNDVAGFVAEIDDTVASIRTGRSEPRLDLTNARDAIHICQALQQSAERKDWVCC